MKNEIYGRIYLITNKINGKMYVGQTIETIQERFSGHVSDSKNINSDGYRTMLIVKAIRKYGKENFTIDELDIAYNQKELNILEGKYMYEYNTLNRKIGYNLREVDLNGNCKHSEASKQKMSQIKSQLKYKEISSETGKQRRGKSYPNTTSKYVGVYLTKYKTWKAVVQMNKKNKVIGIYNTEIDAAQARDIAELEIMSNNAILNFPELKEKYLIGDIKPVKKTKGSYILSNKKSDSKVIGVFYCNTKKRWVFKRKGFKAKSFKTKEEAESYASTLSPV